MPDTKISADAALLGAAVDPAADYFPIVDASAALNKKITVAELILALNAAGVGGGGATALSGLTDVDVTTTAPLDGQPLAFKVAASGVIQHKTSAQDAVATITLPAAPTPGNYLIVCGSAYGGGALLRSTTGQGWTILNFGSASSRDYADIIARKVVAGDTATINLGCAPAQAKLTIWEVASPTVDITTTVPTTRTGFAISGGLNDNLFTTTVPSLVLLTLGWNQGTGTASFVAPFNANTDGQFNSPFGVASSWFTQTAAGVVHAQATIAGAALDPSVSAIAFPLNPPITKWKPGAKSPLLTGGTSKQVLVKQSGVDGDVKWTGVGDTAVPLTGAHAWWRIKYISGNHGSFLSAFDIQFRQVAGVTEHPTGGTVLEAQTRAGFAGSDAFDASDTTRWALNDIANIASAYLGYHFATAISVAQVRMFVSNGETPNSYDIQYSDDGAAWTTALAVRGQTNWATEVLHSLTSTTFGLDVPVAKLSDAVITTPADGQVLTYEASSNKWKNKAPTGGSGGGAGSTVVTPTYKGARVIKTAGNSQSVTLNTWTPVTWDSAPRDTNAFWSSGASTRFTIPAGVTKIKLRGSYWTHDSGAGNFGCRFFKNGTDLDGSASNQATGGNWAFRSVASDVLDVVAGDYFEFVVFSTGGTTVWAAPDTWFALEVVEGSLLNQGVGPSSTVPASATATGTAGQTAYDASFFYICVATNTWKRVAIASW